MKHPIKREIKRLHEKRRREELDRYTALCMQARMLCGLDSGAHDLMNNAMKAVERLSYGVLVSSVRDLQLVLNDIAHGAVVEFLKTYYLAQHWADVSRQISIHSRTHAHEKTSATTRPGPARPQAKIPGQAARFQNYRR